MVDILISTLCIKKGEKKMLSFDQMLNDTFQNKDSTITKDLKLNFKKYLTDNSLEEKTTMLIASSLGFVFDLSELKKYAQERLTALEVSEAQQKETIEIAGFMKMLNTYYKFKNFVNNNTDYNMAGLRMNTMIKPNLSKVEFETLAFAHSLVNACEFCVKAHEQELRKHGLSADNIHDVARLASILSAVGTLLKS